MRILTRKTEIFSLCKAALGSCIGEELVVEKKQSRSRIQRFRGVIEGTYPAGVLVVGSHFRDFIGYLDFYSKVYEVVGGDVVLEHLTPVLQYLRQEDEPVEQTVSA